MHRFFTIWTECLGRCVGFTQCFFCESLFDPIPVLEIHFCWKSVEHAHVVRLGKSQILK